MTSSFEANRDAAKTGEETAHAATAADVLRKERRGVPVTVEERESLPLWLC